jgi:hypothetical protein
VEVVNKLTVPVIFVLKFGTNIKESPLITHGVPTVPTEPSIKMVV